MTALTPLMLLWGNLGGWCVSYNAHWPKRGVMLLQINAFLILNGPEGGCAFHQERAYLLLFVLHLRWCFIRNSHTHTHTQSQYVEWSAHPELLLNGTGVSLRVQAVHVVVDGPELAGGDGGVPTETCLQDGIMDKDILLLKKHSVLIADPSDVIDLSDTTIWEFSPAAKAAVARICCTFASRFQWPLPCFCFGPLAFFPTSILHCLCSKVTLHIFTFIFATKRI